MNDALGKKFFRPVGGHGLHILRQRQRNRAAQRGIGEIGDGARQGDEQLMRRDDAVEIARHRTQAIGGRDATILEVFDLLENRIGVA